MSQNLMHVKNEISAPISGAIERVLIRGDLSGLNEEQRVQYVRAVCDSVGLNILTKPFEYIELNRKLVLYATKACGEQLRKVHSISLKIASRELLGDVYVVTADAKTPDGREDSSTGAVSVKGLAGEALANAYMKAETKAKRRVTLSICGLAVLDESEVDSASDDRSNLEGNGNTDPNVRGYRIPFGQYRQRSLEEVGPKALGEYIMYLEKNSEKKGTPLEPEAVEFIKLATDFIVKVENGEQAPVAPVVPKIISPPRVQPNPAVSRIDLGRQINAIAKSLNYSAADIGNHSMHLFKKATKDLTIEEMQALLADLEETRTE